jgi:hypothetical protein
MDTPDQERSRSRAFMSLLVEDVIAARERLSASDTQTTRRDVVRASLAAIEGMTWIAREHVRIGLETAGELSPVADLALQELSFSISPNGTLRKQVRPVPLLTTIRLVVSQAQNLSSEISVNFLGRGWSNLRRAVEIRNRITHPKPNQSMAIEDSDLAVVGSSVSWLLATVEFIMASVNLALNEQSDLLRRLIAGDPDALAEYDAALRAMGDSDS